MASTPEEWFRQADYDMDTADYMLAGGRNVYAVFMCHLSIEKALKGIWHKKLGVMPPRTHNLMMLIRRNEMSPSEHDREFLSELNEMCVVTRYPDDLANLGRGFDEKYIGTVLSEGRKVLSWTKQIFSEL